MYHVQTSGRCVKANHANSLPRRVVIIDCVKKQRKDSNGNVISQQKLRFGCCKSFRLEKSVATRERHATFTDGDSLREWVYGHTCKSHTTWIVGYGVFSAFNLAGFAADIDSGLLVMDSPRSKRQRENNDADDPHTSGLLVLECPPTIIALRNTETDGRVVIVDLLNWFPMPLSILAENSGCEFQDEPGYDETDTAWEGYCQCRTEVIYKSFLSLIDFMAKNRFGNFRYTIASQAMSAFRHGRMPHKIYVHDNKQAKTLERAAYFSGRSEIFQYGEIRQQCHMVDANSLFPFIMKTTPAPYILRTYETDENGKLVIGTDRAALAVADVHMCATDSLYPARASGHTVYPVGTFRTNLCGPELELAVKANCICSVYAIAQYDTILLFEQYVNDLFALRQKYKLENQYAMEQLVKTMANSLYGKFAQKQPKWENCPDQKWLPEWSQMAHMQAGDTNPPVYRKFGPYCQKFIGDVEKQDSFIAISAFITSAARVYMNNVRTIAGKGNVYYQGVDGLIVNTDGLCNLESAGFIHQTELGKFKVKSSGSPTTILGIGDYRIGSHVVVAGRKNTARQLDENTWLQSVLMARSMLFRGKTPDSIEELSVKWRRKSMPAECRAF